MQEGLEELGTLCTTQLLIRRRPHGHCIPQPWTSVQKLLEKAQVVAPRSPCRIAFFGDRWAGRSPGGDSQTGELCRAAFFGDLPAALPHRGVHVATRKKLPPRRKTR